ncbi:MAG: FAD-dependent oxidoreductase [Patescibacteria group bacterium]|nr:FAD-dependent oxidoreductase [Patescibacteria group bacterium]
MVEKIYPIAIIGSGIAGLTASIYASRYQIEHLIIGEIPGGIMSESVVVENFPGFKSITGLDLAKRLKEQVLSYKPTWEYDSAVKIKEEKNNFVISTKNQKEFKAHFLILATGTKRRKLGVSGEKELIGKGVHSCVTCDGYFYKDKNVLIVGGGDAGVTAALSITNLAKKVYLLNNLDKLTAMPFWQEKLKTKKNVEIILNNNVKKFVGKDFLEKVILEKSHNGKNELIVDGVFVEIGADPNTDLAKSLNLKLDKRDFLQVGCDQKSSHNRVYGAGDASSGSNHFHQMLTAASEGAIAIDAIYQEIQKS